MAASCAHRREGLGGAGEWGAGLPVALAAQIWAAAFVQEIRASPQVHAKNLKSKPWAEGGITKNFGNRVIQRRGVARTDT
jgi:hypothetical protein